MKCIFTNLSYIGNFFIFDLTLNMSIRLHSLLEQITSFRYFLFSLVIPLSIMLMTTKTSYKCYRPWHLYLVLLQILMPFFFTKSMNMDMFIFWPCHFATENNQNCLLVYSLSEICNVSAITYKNMLNKIKIIEWLQIIYIKSCKSGTCTILFGFGIMYIL